MSGARSGTIRPILARFMMNGFVLSSFRAVMELWWNPVWCYIVQVGGGGHGVSLLIVVALVLQMADLLMGPVSHVYHWIECFTLYMLLGSRYFVCIP